MNIVNLTPHPISIRYAEETTTIPSSGLARCAEALYAEPDGGRPFHAVRVNYSAVEGLPEPAPDTIYVVSGLVLTALAGSRSDVWAPYSGGDPVYGPKRTNGHIDYANALVH